eukprot:13640557-Ditylum_brightwellii.AAC.1
MQDANSNIDEAELSEFIAEAKLFNLMGTKDGMGSPNTHIGGLNAVNFTFGLEDAVDPTEKVEKIDKNTRDGITEKQKEKLFAADTDINKAIIELCGGQKNYIEPTKS